MFTFCRYTNKHAWGTRFWAVYAPDGSLVCVTLYRKGAVEVVRRLSEGL